MRKGVMTVIAAAAVVAAGPVLASPHWVEARTEHFVIRIDATEQVARDYAIKLERFDSALRRLYAVPDDPSRRANPLQVFAMKEGLFLKVCGCGNAAGYYKPAAGGSAMFSIYQPDLDDKAKQGEMTPQVVLLHEYSHHFMFTNYPLAYPRWYSEGFAEFNANAAFSTDGSITIGYPANYRAYAIRNEYQELTVREFFEPPSDGYPVDTLYGRGWLMTHYLTLDPARRGQLDVYLAEFNKGRTSLQAAQTAFGNLNTLYADLFAYRRRKTGLAKPLRIPPAAGLPEVTVRPLSAGAAAMMPYHLYLANGLSAKRAGAMVRDAERVAADYGVDAPAQVDLGGIELAAGNFDAADAAADRALSADAQNRDALLLKGQVAVRRAGKAASVSPAIWTQARSWYLKANKLAPDASLPLLYYYQSFIAAGQTPSPGAVAALKRAVVVAPEDSTTRLLLARRILGEGDGASARALLQPIAFSPHQRADDNVARAAIVAIDAGKMDDAAKAIDAAIAEDAKTE